MTTAGRRLLMWSPRVLGILVGLFIGLFSLDALDEGVGPLLLHTVPAVFLLLIVAASWRREWVGALVFMLLAVAYTPFAWQRGHPEWLLPISGPLLLVGVLFFLSWRRHAELHAPRGGPRGAA